MSKIKRGPIVAVLIIGAFVAILNETLLNIAFPDLVHEFGIQLSTVQWLSTAYMLVIGVLVPVTALLQQWFTTRQMFLSALLLFLAGTVICGFAPVFEVMLVGRIVQALGTGLMLPVMMNTMLIIFPPEERGGAMGMIGLVIMFAPAVGPTLSGLIIDVLNWRWLFFLVIPLAVFAVIFSAIYLKNVSTITRPKVDFLSILLSTVGFGCIVYGFSKAGESSWSEPVVGWCIGIGIVALLFFVWRQLTMKEPMLDLRAFKYPMFTIAAILLIVVIMSLFSTMALLPFFLQGVLLYSVFKSGLVLLPGGVVNGIMSPVAGKLFDKFGPRVLVIPGLVLVCTATWLFSGISASAGAGYVIFLHVVMLIGISLVMMPTQTTGLNQLPPHLYPHGTAIMNTLQQVFGAIGMALFMSILSSGQKNYLANAGNPQDPQTVVASLVAGLQDAFTVGGVFSLIALVVAFFLKRVRAPEGQAQSFH
ncbi:DHA2 family efflux MFS transporter permease subunit [Cohnella laeviribosi]|uniref:DHA2 family efflux MFS transporter permease subunit n=1 Tax=Cohnella laeviribosi TaxID=380174 RepID=UPI003D239A17